jgi:hypothetical protein
VDYDSAKKIFERLESIRDPGLACLKDDMYELALKYAQIRARWNFLDEEERGAQSRTRSAVHDAFIDSCNILSRAILKEGSGDSEWRRILGKDRKEIGDFACYLTCLLGLTAR